MSNEERLPKGDLKRKSKPHASSSRKRAKIVVSHADDLPWKTVSRSREADLGDSLDGILDLEVVDDVEVFYEETDGGRVVRFRVRLCFRYVLPLLIALFYLSRWRKIKSKMRSPKRITMRHSRKLPLK